MSGETPVVALAGRSMTQIVSAIPVVAEQTGREVVLIGGLAVMCRLPTPYRATTDVDTVDRRASDEDSQLQLLVAAGATRSGPAGALVRTPWGEVQVDVLEVTDADIDALPSDPTDRLHVLSMRGRRAPLLRWCSARRSFSLLPYEWPSPVPSSR